MPRPPALGDKGWSPPNVVLIVADDMGWTDFGFMGHDVVRTPHLDKLANESAVFPNGYVPTSLCRAAWRRCSPGMYAHQHKICCNDPPDGVDRIADAPVHQEGPGPAALLGGGGLRQPADRQILGRALQNAGFTDGMTDGKGRHGDEGLVIGRKTMKPIYDFIDGRKENNAVLRLVRADDAARAARPAEAHPREVPRRTGRTIELAKYYAMCEWFDETCRRSSSRTSTQRS